MVRSFADYMPPITAHVPRKVTLFCPFGGGGGGAFGGQQARSELFGRAAVVELLGGIDNVDSACLDFEYLTGVPQACRDVSTMTSADLREMVGLVPPDIVFSSPPCKSSSKLLPAARAAEPKYQAMSQLALVMTRLLLSTWDRPPPLLVYENVPNITSRAKAMVAQLRKLLMANGYAIQDGFHDCGDVGNLGQRRKRWFFVARHQPQIPFFLYKPPRKGLRSCGSVLADLPMPNDVAGGPMHDLPAISAINWARLWAIPAGGDWRDLIQDSTPRRKRFRRQHVERWIDPSVTIAGVGSNGPYAVQDPRAGDTAPPPFEATGMLVQLGENGAPLEPVQPPTSGFPGAYGVLDPSDPAGAVTGNARISTGAFSIADTFGHTNRVTPWTEPAGTVTHSPAPSSGAIAVADPRPPVSLTNQRFKGSLGVLDPAQPSGAVTGEAYPSTGPFSIAMKIDPTRHTNHYVVTPADAPVRTITGATRPGSGAQSIADPITHTPPSLIPQAGNPDLHYGKYNVLDPTQPAPPVTGSTRVGSGAPSIADMSLLVPRKPAYDRAYSVLDPQEPSPTVAAKSFVGCGGYAYPTVLPLTCEQRAGSYGVLDPQEPAKTIVAHMKVDNSPAAIAAQALPAGYGVLPYSEAKKIATGEVRAPFMVVDRSDPTTPLAIVDRLDRAPYRWVTAPAKARKKPLTPKQAAKAEASPRAGKRKKVYVPLVMISADGTWHRPLTTLELARLQGLPWMHNGAPLKFSGGSTDNRTCIGNMVPPPTAKAIIMQMLLSVLAADSGCFYLDSGGAGVWCKPEDRERLRREGIEIVQPSKIIRLGDSVVCDDGAIVKSPSRRKRAGSKMMRRPAPRARHEAHLDG